MAKLPRYRVKLLSQLSGVVDGYIEEATQADIPPNTSENWKCNWREFWLKADFQCEAIIKLHYQDENLGFIHFGIYPFPSQSPESVYIEHLECIEKKKRLVNPIGFWLIWYATKISLEYCIGDEEESVVLLVATIDAIDYYRNKVMMEGKKWVTLSSTEDGYAFRFTKKDAEQYCNRIETEYGVPILLE